MRTIAAILLTVFIFDAPSASEERPSIIDLASTDRHGILEIQGKSAYDKMGLALAVTDFDGDGYDDLLMGAPYTNNSTGSAYIFFGSADHGDDEVYDLNTYDGNDIVRIRPEQSGGFFGYWCGGGDFNGDGFGDFAIGATNRSPLGRSGAGEVIIVFGESGARSDNDVTIGDDTFRHIEVYGVATTGEHGFRLGSGDFNGDGFDDMISGAIHAGGTDSRSPGEAYIVFGSPMIDSRGAIDLSDSGDGILTIHAVGYGFDYPDNLGYSVASGDVNGDGIDDALVSARFADPSNIPNAGEAYVIFGSPTLHSIGDIRLAERPQGTIRISGEHEHSYTGDDSGIGDVDGDGFYDIIINAYAADPLGRANAGITYVVPGSSSLSTDGDIELGSLMRTVVRIYGEAGEDHMEPLSAGDIDGDGFMDIVSGALNHDPFDRPSAGTGYIIYGSADFFKRKVIDLLQQPEDVTYLRGATAGDRMARTCAGDFNGDGFDDAVIAAVEGDAHGCTDTGKVYIYWGVGINPSVRNHFTFESDTGNNATILVTAPYPPLLFGVPLSNGDIIGVFTPGGICAGAGTWRGVNLAITVWGDNDMVDGVSGFLANEEMTFKIYDYSEDKEYMVTPEFSLGDGLYHPNGIYVLSSLDTGITNIKNKSPAAFSLAQNTPNPFNPSTTIRFSLGEASKVSLTVYAVSGAKIATLTEGVLSAGEHEVVWDASGFPSGVYFCRLKAGANERTIKMTLVK